MFLMNYDFLENIYFSMKDGVYAFDLNGEITHVNPSACSTLGYREDELKGMVAHFAFHAHSHDIGLLDCPIYKSFLNNVGYMGEAIFATKQGVLVDVSVSANVMYCEGNKIGYVVSFRDISEKKRMEKERDALYEVFQNTEDIIVIKDLDLKVIATNQAFAKASGHQSVDELIGKTDAQIFGVTPDIEPIATYMADEKRAQQLKPGKSILREEPVIFPDGSTKVYKTRKFPIYKNGVVFATANISMDITHEKAYAQDLETKISQEESRNSESEAFYNKIFDTANLGICLTNTEGRFVMVNPAYCEIYGYVTSELIGHSFTMVVPKEHQTLMQKLHDDFLIHRNVIEIGSEWEVVRKDGERIWIYASAGILDGIIGGPYKITTVSDVTELVLARKKEKDQNAMLVQQSKLAAMGEMIGNIAHQWRQPLNVINCTTLDIKMQKDMKRLSDEKLEKSLVEIENLTEQMSETINDFMNFYNPNKQKKSFLLYGTILFAYKIISPQLKSNKITLSLNIDETLLVYGPPSELQQVILNLISNTKDAFIEREIENRQLSIYSTQDDNFIYLCVQDNAGGIEESIMERIFEPYFTTKESLNGTGIGLYMSAMILRKSFGGDIKVENIRFEGKSIGAKFTIIFPKEK